MTLLTKCKPNVNHFKMFTSNNSKSTVSQLPATDIQVIIDNSANKKASSERATTLTQPSVNKLAWSSSSVPRGPRSVWYDPKVSDPTTAVTLEDQPNFALTLSQIIIKTAPKHHRTNRPLPTITEWTTSTPSSQKIILSQRQISGGDIEYTLGTKHGDTVIQDPECCHLEDILDHVSETELRTFDSKELKEWADAEEVATQHEIAHLQRKRDRQNHLRAQLRKCDRPTGSKRLGRPKKGESLHTASGAIHTSIDQGTALSSRTERRLQRNGTTTEEAFIALPQVKKRIERPHENISTGTSTTASSRLQSVVGEDATDSDDVDATAWMTDQERTLSESVVHEAKLNDAPITEVAETDEDDRFDLESHQNPTSGAPTTSVPTSRFRMLFITSRSSDLLRPSISASPSETQARSPSLPEVAEDKSEVIDLVESDNEDDDATQLLRRFQGPSLQAKAESNADFNTITPTNEGSKTSSAAPKAIHDHHVQDLRASRLSAHIEQLKTPPYPAARTKPKTPSRISLTPLYPSNAASPIPRRRPSPFPSLSPPGKKAKKESSTQHAKPLHCESTNRALPLGSTSSNTAARRSSNSIITNPTTRHSSATKPIPHTAPPINSRQSPTLTASSSNPVPTGTAAPITTPAPTDTEPDVFIDAILDHRVIQQGSKRLIEYLVKWEGFPAEEAEWHGENALLDAEDVIQAYTIRKVGAGRRLRA